MQMAYKHSILMGLSMQEQPVLEVVPSMMKIDWLIHGLGMKSFSSLEVIYFLEESHFR